MQECRHSVGVRTAFTVDLDGTFHVTVIDPCPDPSCADFVTLKQAHLDSMTNFVEEMTARHPLPKKVRVREE